MDDLNGMASASSIKQDNPLQGELSFLDIVRLILARRNLVIGLPIVAGIITAVLTLAIPNTYTGVARILPPQQGSGGMAAALLSQVGGGLSSALGGGLAAGLGLKNPSDLYVGMLKTDVVADAVIQRFRLQYVYGEGTLIGTRERLDSLAEIKAGREGIITISFEDREPMRAAAVTNAFIEELDKLAQTLEVTEATRRRSYLEKQLNMAKDNLKEAELGLKKVQEKTGLITLEEQGRAIIEAVAAVRAEIAAKEIQLGAMRTFATPNNPDFVRAEQELRGLRTQLERLEKKSQFLGEGNILIPTGVVPEVALEYMQRFRDLKYFEQLFEFVAKQYEIAKADAAREVWTIQVVDSAGIPDKKSKPRRALIVIIVSLLSFVLTVIGLIILDMRKYRGSVVAEG
jgi:tyrosine-protein kinase Etk/Wzc